MGVTEDKGGHSIVIKGSLQKQVIIFNTHASKTGAPRHVKQMLTPKGRN